MIGQLGSVILVIALQSLRQIVITHISIVLAHVLHVVDMYGAQSGVLYQSLDAVLQYIELNH